MLKNGETARVGLYFDADGEWWMSFADFLQHFDQVEMCHVPRPDTWAVDTWHGEWTREESAGGSRNHLDTFALNPQYFVTLTDPDEFDDEDLCTMVVSLIQKRKGFDEDADQDELLSIGIL